MRNNQVPCNQQCYFVHRSAPQRPPYPSHGVGCSQWLDVRIPIDQCRMAEPDLLHMLRLQNLVWRLSASQQMREQPLPSWVAALAGDQQCIVASGRVRMLEPRRCCNRGGVVSSPWRGKAGCNKVLVKDQLSVSTRRSHKSMCTVSRSVSFSKCLESEIPMIVPNNFLRHRWEIWLSRKHPTPLSKEQAAWENMRRMANNQKKMGTLIRDASALVADVLMHCKGLLTCLAFFNIAGAPPVFSNEAPIASKDLEGIKPRSV